MIILDTNVIAEAMKGPHADPCVLRWLRALPSTPVTTIINRAEVLAGIEILPEGRRKTALATAAHAAFGMLGACLPLTSECADRYAEIVAARLQAGKPITTMDALIAAIALETGAAVATRDEGGFEGLGLTVINPFTGGK